MNHSLWFTPDGPALVAELWLVALARGEPAKCLTSTPQTLREKTLPRMTNQMRSTRRRPWSGFHIRQEGRV